MANGRTVSPAAQPAPLIMEIDLDPDACPLAGAAGSILLTPPPPPPPSPPPPLLSHQPREGNPLQVLVRDNNIDQALRVLKKKIQEKASSAR